MDDYLAKPIRPAELDHAIDKWLPVDGNRAAANTVPELITAPAAGDPLDADVIAGLQGDLDPGMRERLLGTFEESLKEHLPELDAALLRADEQEVRRLLHLLKGSSATIGARALSEACRTAEALVGSDHDALTGLVADVETLAAKTIAELRARLLDEPDAVPLATNG